MAFKKNVKKCNIWFGVHCRVTHVWGLTVVFACIGSMVDLDKDEHFCEHFRLIGALHQVKVLLNGFSAKSWFLVKVDDLRSQIFFVIRAEGHNGRLHAQFQPFISLYRTKCSLYKIRCHKVSNCPPIHTKNGDFFLKPIFFIKLEQKIFFAFQY